MVQLPILFISKSSSNIHYGICKFPDLCIRTVLYCKLKTVKIMGSKKQEFRVLRKNLIFFNKCN